MADVVIQFSFSSFSAVPRSIQYKVEEPEGRRANVRQRPTGVKLMDEPVQSSSLAKVVEELQETHSLARVRVQERFEPRSGKQYAMVRFVFSTTPVEMDEAERQILEAALRQLVEGSFWRVRSFVNPGDDGNFVSINCEVREPRYRADGSPVTICDRDESGEKIRGSAKPIQPKWEPTLTEVTCNYAIAE